MFIDWMEARHNLNHRFDKTDIVNTFRDGFCATPTRIPSLIRPSVKVVVVSNTIGIHHDGPLFVCDFIERRKMALFNRR